MVVASGFFVVVPAVAGDMGYAENAGACKSEYMARSDRMTVRPGTPKEVRGGPSADAQEPDWAELRAETSKLRDKVAELERRPERRAEGDLESRTLRRRLAEDFRETGDNYRHGYSGPKDAVEALAHYLQAIEFGDVQVYNRIAALYLSGELGVADFARARKALLEGVEKGDAGSARLLGGMHFAGTGAEKSPQLARGWWIMAAKLGSWRALEDIMRLYFGCHIAAGDWRIRGLGWGLLALADGRFGDGEIARLIAGRESLAPFTVDEIRSARRVANAFDEAHPGWRQRAAPRQPGYGEDPR
jgi:hypothetical protein